MGLMSVGANADGRSWWRDDRARPLVGVGLLLVASGLAHIVVWALLGGPWEGAVAWRKPILFGISAGLTSLSLGWVCARLTRRRGDALLAWVAALSLLVEVALIDLQRWRGVASHFNRATPFDSMVSDVMGWLILVVTVVCIDLTARFLRRPPAAMSPDMILAARAGLVLLVVSCLLGIWSSLHGEARRLAGLAPETVGAAGVAKFPHGAVIHAIQWLPLLAWAARRAGVDAPRRVWLVASATAGTVLVLAYALGQTLAGRTRFDATPAAAAVLACGAAGLAVPAAVTAWTWWWRPRGEPGRVA